MEKSASLSKSVLVRNKPQNTIQAQLAILIGIYSFSIQENIFLESIPEVFEIACRLSS